jgi:hypothetical protein
MAVSMQGTWTVSVKSKEAGSTPQRFIIAGAATGNGTYTGDTSTPHVHVTGVAWSIEVQHQVGAAWVHSFDEITFPVHTGANYAFDVKANDDEVDPVFDDLILTCTTPVGQTNFVLFGNVSWYGVCLFSPCSSIYPHFAIESEAALQAALLRPALRHAIQTLYPERVYPKPVGPGPDPGPFRPLLLPIEGNPVVPAQQAKVFHDTEADAQAAARAPTGQLATLHVPAAHSAARVSALDVANLVSPRRSLCQSGALADYLLRFEDYTPTAAEAAGGPYTGTGARNTLGYTTTDRNGNYVFHFTVPCEPIFDARFLHNISVPFPHCIVPLPNIIIQVLDGTAPSGVLYETAPNFNTPQYARIDVCVPKSAVTLPPACVTGQIIQSIGNITVGPLVAGTRHTADTSLDANGVITSSSALGPHVTCAAWGGGLYFYACLSNPAIARYTIRYGRPTNDSTELASFQFVQEDYSPYRVVPAPVYLAPQSVGATTTHSLETEPGVFRIVPSYLNAETDTTTPWLERWKVLKVVLTSSFYQTALGGPGPIEFRIQGYDSSGNQVAGADDNITLYVDNNGVDQFLDPNIALITTTGSVPQSDCALFTLPPDQPAAPIRISFRSNQNEGFMDTYTLSMDKGSTGGFPIVSTSAIVGTYAPADCTFHGTSDEPGYGATVANELTVQVTPATGTWLNGATFCAFSINLSSTVRVTDGQGVFGPFNSTPDLIGIQQGT